MEYKTGYQNIYSKEGKGGRPDYHPKDRSNNCVHQTAVASREEYHTKRQDDNHSKDHGVSMQEPSFRPAR